MNKYKYIYIGSLAIMFTLTLFLAYFYYLLFIPVKAIDVQIPPAGAEVLNTQPLRGNENVYYGLTFCNYTKPKMEVVYTLISIENEYKSFIVITRPPHASADSFDDSQSQAFQPCSYMIDGSVQLPKNIPNGRYIIGVNIISHVNHLRNQSTFFETEPFTVKGGEEE